MSVSFTKGQLEREAWLLYFNQVLLDRGVITEDVYCRMLLRIKTREKLPPEHAGTSRGARAGGQVLFHTKRIIRERR